MYKNMKEWGRSCVYLGAPNMHQIPTGLVEALPPISIDLQPKSRRVDAEEEGGSVG